jgi:hypothetical protein
MGCGSIIVHISGGEARCHNISRRHFAMVNIIINVNVNNTIAVTKKTPIKFANCLITYQLSNCEEYSLISMDVTV